MLKSISSILQKIKNFPRYKELWQLELDSKLIMKFGVLGYDQPWSVGEIFEDHGFAEHAWYFIPESDAELELDELDPIKEEKLRIIHSKGFFVLRNSCSGKSFRLFTLVYEGKDSVILRYPWDEEHNWIYFYSVNKPYGFMSNFALYPIELDGKTWPTSEHYFQAQKFLDEKYQEKIRKATSCLKAASLGRNRSIPIRQDWEAVKEEIMHKAVYAKFNQHAELTKMLLDTKESELVEHTVNDAYWGDNGTTWYNFRKKGKNRLGEILMRVRAEVSFLSLCKK